MTQALVPVEQGQLGSGVRPLAAHDDAGAGRVAVQEDHGARFIVPVQKALSRFRPRAHRPQVKRRG